MHKYTEIAETINLQAVLINLWHIQLTPKHYLYLEI